jgi:hypothetical protein
MNIKKLVFWITMLSIFAMAARFAVDSDTWWHLRTGKWILENRSIPHVDYFSYTRNGHIWLYVSMGWIAECVIFILYDVLGPGGLMLWVAGIVTITYALVWKVLSGNVFLRAFVIVFSATAAGVYWAARPYMITFLLSAVSLWILEDFRWHRKDRVWLLPVIMILWANNHGGFAVGFLIYSVYAVNEVVGWLNLAHEGENPLNYKFDKKWIHSGLKGRVGRFLLIGILMIVGVCINPSGLSALTYPFQTISIGALQDLIAEWQSPNFHDISVQPFAWFLLFTFGVIGISKKRLMFIEFLLVAGFAYMGLLAGRNIAIFALITPVVLTRHADGILLEINRNLSKKSDKNDAFIQTKKRNMLNLMIFGLVALAVIIKVSLVYPKEFHEEIFRDTLPMEAIEQIKSRQPPGNLFNSYNWGGYLIWELPEYPVFIEKDGSKRLRTGIFD